MCFRAATASYYYQEKQHSADLIIAKIEYDSCKDLKLSDTPPKICILTPRFCPRMCLTAGKRFVTKPRLRP